MKIKINNLSYSVLLVDKVSIEGCIGCIQHSKQIIEIDKNMSDELKVRTFIHELTHGYLWSYGIGDTQYNEETVCNFLGSYYQLMFKQIEQFKKFIKESKKVHE